MRVISLCILLWALFQSSTSLPKEGAERLHDAGQTQLFTGASAKPDSIAVKLAMLLASDQVNLGIQYLMREDSGMVYVPSGKMRFGNDYGLPRERPARDVQVDAFLIDRHPVTVAEFRAFVKSSSYLTQAERDGGSSVLDIGTGTWITLKGAYWELPLGPDGHEASDDHPVTHVSWHDAQAYCTWAGKRMISEMEWEYAAKCAGTHGSLYPWGHDDIKAEGAYLANVWNGQFPDKNTREDGFIYTNPVGYFGSNPLGISDMAGNVWEWCSDHYRPYPSAKNEEDIPLDNMERVRRGGSFLCHPSYCHGFRVTARSGDLPKSSAFHVGFRCAKDIDPTN